MSLRTKQMENCIGQDITPLNDSKCKEIMLKDRNGVVAIEVGTTSGKSHDTGSLKKFYSIFWIPEEETIIEKRDAARFESAEEIKLSVFAKLFGQSCHIDRASCGRCGAQKLLG